MNGQRRGRKPLPEDQRRNDSFHVRISEQEAHLLYGAARSIGQPLSEFVRSTALREAERVQALEARLKRSSELLTDSDTAAPSAG